MKNSKVSVLMPVYNQDPNYLKEAIESILNQTLVDFEFIIVDDGCTLPDCIEMLAHYCKKDSRIKLIKNPSNFGLPKTRNIALAVAKGEYVAIQDSDDVSDIERLGKQLIFLEQNSGVVLVGSSCRVIDENGKEQYHYETFSDDFTLRVALAFHNNFTHGSVMMRKDAARQVGGYSNWTTVAEDYDLYVKLSKLGKLANIEEMLYCWRENPKGISSKNKQILAEKTKSVTEKYRESILLSELAAPAKWEKNWQEYYSGKSISVSLKKRFAKLNFELAIFFLQKKKNKDALCYFFKAMKFFPVGFVLREYFFKKIY